MKVEVKRTYNGNFYFVWKEDNTVVESGLMNEKEYSDEILELFYQLMYYANNETFKELLESHKGEFEDAGYTITKDNDEEK
jgi:hypothetical protein